MPRFEPHPDRRAAVVTGASSGIGQATALALAEAGHPVVLGARRLDRLEDTADKIVADGGEALALLLDLTDDASIDAFAEAAQAQLGPIEVVVSNAGEVLPATALGVEPDEFVRQVQTNVLGAHRLVRRLGPPMVDRGRGDIVFVSSDVVRLPRTYMAAYITSKHALEGLARAMQMELEGTGVRVGVVRPGPATTGQGATWDPAVIDEVLGDWDRWGIMRHPGYLRPVDVARAVLAVVSTPRGTHLTLVEVEPEAPAGGNE
jgi:NAD(P)-dependent dehydrogenase (short-subunit alcohol dehydrogenase family)